MWVSFPSEKIVWNLEDVEVPAITLRSWINIYDFNLSNLWDFLWGCWIAFPWALSHFIPFLKQHDCRMEDGIIHIYANKDGEQHNFIRDLCHYSCSSCATWHYLHMFQTPKSFSLFQVQHNSSLTCIKFWRSFQVEMLILLVSTDYGFLRR